MNEIELFTLDMKKLEISKKFRKKIAYRGKMLYNNNALLTIKVSRFYKILIK